MESQLYKKFAEIEEKMWWFRARKNIIEEVIIGLVAKFNNKLDILDFGAGIGILSQMMSKYGQVTAVDNNQEAATHGRFPIKMVDSLDGFADKSFDLITAFDVLEHCKDDERIISEFRRLLRPGGFVFTTVPAYQCLWSYHDVVSHHFRRYSRKDLIRKFKQAGFQIDRVSYFNSFLFPFFVLNIIFNRLSEKIRKTGQDSLSLPCTPLNKLLFEVFNIEKKWLKKRNFFYGSSLLLLAINK